MPYYPVQRNIRLHDSTAVTAGGRFFRADRLASAVNRRLYRQGRIYNVKLELEVGSPLATAGVDVYVLNNTWDLQGAYRYAMQQYYDTMKEEMKTQGGNPRWHDFRVIPDFQSDELVGVSYNPQAAAPVMDADENDQGDHSFSSVTDATGATKSFTLDDVGSATEFSIISEWRAKAQVQEDPAQVSTSMPYADLKEDVDEANYDLLRVRGEFPPYATQATNDLYVKVTTLKETGTGVQKLTSGYFEAPLGVVILVSSGFIASGTAAEQPINVHFQKGDYKGINAPSYVEATKNKDGTVTVM